VKKKEKIVMFIFTVMWSAGHWKKPVLVTAVMWGVGNVLCIMMLAGLESWIKCIFLLRKNEKDFEYKLYNVFVDR